MTTGPTMRERLMLAPSSITTRPMSLAGVVHVAVDPPVEALQDHAVDLQHVGDVPGVLPVARDDAWIVRRDRASMRYWMAWVISNSPRPEGRMARTASWIAGVKRYTPTSARSLLGCSGFSSRPITWPSASSSATPKERGSGTWVSRIWASGRSRAELVDEVADAADDEVVAEVHDEVVVTEEVPCDQHRVGQAQRLLLRDVGDLQAELRSVADRLLDLGGGVTDDRCRPR